MSEFLAEARIVVRPDTSRFRADLEAQLKSVVARPIKIPVIPVVASGFAAAGGAGFAAAAAGSAAFAAAQSQVAASTAISADALAAATTIERQYAGAVDLSAVSTQALAAAQEKEAITATQATAAQAAHTRSVAGAGRGAAASALTLFGLRGATLAASGAFLAGTAAVVGFSKAVQSAAALETELNVFRVTARATADEMDRVSASAKQLGRDITLPGVTAGSAATAMTELAKAGLSVEDSIAGARGALQLATAAQIDVKQSTELVANSLNAFGLAGEDAVKIADLLAGAAKSAQGEIGEFGTALGQVASVADQFGVSAADTVTLLAQLAKAGLQGGRAGTTLRVAILGLIKPTAAARVELEKLQKEGVRITKPNGAFDPTAFAQINEALKRYSKEQQNVVRNTIFSSDAIKVLGRATSGGVQDFNAMNDAVTEAGLGLEASSARTQGFTGSMENLNNQVGGFGLTIGEIAKGPLKVFVDALAAEVGVLNDGAGAVITITGEIKKFAEQLVNTIPFIDDFKAALDDAFGGGDGGGGIGDSIKKGILGGLNLLPSILIELAKQFDDTAQEGAKLKDVLDELANAGTFGITKLSAALPDVGLGVKQIQNIITGFDAQEVRAKIAGDNAKLLDVLNTEQAFLQRQLTRDFVKRRPALQRAIEQALLGTVNDIEAVQAKATSAAESLKRDAEKAASDAAQAVKDREQALLSAQGVSRAQRQNKIDAAAQTKPLQDDIAQQKKLKALVLAQIAAVRERISIEGGRAAAIAALRSILIQVDKSLTDLATKQQQAKKEQRDALLQGISLDIAFDQTTNNQKKEIDDRNKLIAQLKIQLASVKKGTNAYKEIRNAIAEQRAAIDAITGEKKKTNNSFAQASFEFLQAQQGFAANLLGNLIPGGATGGLVGGGQRVGAALQPAVGSAEARSLAGPTAGQGNATNHLLAGILQQLKELNGETKAPEAHRQHRSQRSIMDGRHGG